MKKKDMVGKVFGKLTVVRFSHIDYRREAIWECLCECGNMRQVAGSLLRDGRTKNCGNHKRQVSPKTFHNIIDNIEYKWCSSCHNWKPLGSFHKNKLNWDGFSYRCKLCIKDKAINYRENSLVYKKEYRKIHHKEIIEKALEYVTKRSKYDIGFRLRNVLASRIRMAIKKNGIRKANKTTELIGCSIDYLKKYLEEKFDKNMTWDNYGSYWHIDHINPCASFDLSSPDQQYKCFHYTNLQPLEAKENIRKGAKI